MSSRQPQGPARRERGCPPRRTLVRRRTGRLDDLAHRPPRALGLTAPTARLAARALPWLPLAALLAVAAGHAALVRCCALSPWLGGGFGMFSTVDARAVRVLRDESGTELALPRSLEDEADRAATLPTEARLLALARRLARRPEHAGAALRVEAWETRFAPSLAREPRLLRALRVGAADGRP